VPVEGPLGEAPAALGADEGEGAKRHGSQKPAMLLAGLAEAVWVQVGFRPLAAATEECHPWKDISHEVGLCVALATELETSTAR